MTTSFHLFNFGDGNIDISVTIIIYRACAEWVDEEVKNNAMKSIIFSLVVYLVVAFNSAASQSIVHTLPGYPGFLPLKLETGFVSFHLH